MEIWRQQYLGLETVPPSLTNAEIDFFFAPSDEAWAIIAQRRTPMTRFGLILHVGFLKMTGRSLSAIDLIPGPVLACAAKHAEIPALQIATLRAIYRRPKPSLLTRRSRRLR